MSEAAKVLVVVTSHGDINGVPTTGIWFTEFSEPYAILTEAGAVVTVASPRGGPAPVDPRGYPDRQHIADARDALACLNATQHLDAMRAEDFDGIFLPGGHGPMFDLATNASIKKLIAAFWDSGKPVAAVCHGPAALLQVALGNGSTLLSGRRVTGFSHAEEAEDALTEYMPFSLQDRMVHEGCVFVEERAHQPHVETDGGLLVTGQNPASAAVTAQAFLQALQEKGVSR